MAKQVVESLVQGGKATAAPPLGPALGPLGVNIGKVVAEINKKTESFVGMQVPVKVEVDSETKEFTISIGTPPASSLIKQEANLKKGSGKPNSEFVADMKIEQIIKIAKMKEDALTGKTLKEKVLEIAGTCHSMGVRIEGQTAAKSIADIRAGTYNKEILGGKTEISKEEREELEKERKAFEESNELAHKKEEAENAKKEVVAKPAPVEEKKE